LPVLSNALVSAKSKIHHPKYGLEETRWILH